mgnify:CR=1 FL=1
MLIPILAVLLLLPSFPADDLADSSPLWLSLKADKPNGKHIVFITGDEEYRSEEGMPQLARILSRYHGFQCTVLFSIDSESGCIDRGFESLQSLQPARLSPGLRRGGYDHDQCGQH